MAVDTLVDPIPPSEVLRDRWILVQPLANTTGLSDSRRQTSGIMTPKEVALHHFLGAYYPTPYAMDRVGFRDRDFASIQERIAAQLVDARATADPRYARSLYITGGFMQVMFHPERDAFFDISEAIATLGKHDTLAGERERYTEYSENFARWAIPYAPEYSAVLETAVEEQQVALSALYGSQTDLIRSWQRES